MKEEHANNEAVTEDAAASAYVENFGLKIFATADTEDRKGKATRYATLSRPVISNCAHTDGRGR